MGFNDLDYNDKGSGSAISVIGGNVNAARTDIRGFVDLQFQPNEQGISGIKLTFSKEAPDLVAATDEIPEGSLCFDMVNIDLYFKTSATTWEKLNT